MTKPTWFTVEADYKAVIADSIMDLDHDPDTPPISATVTFTPLLATGDVILATTAQPRPTGYLPTPIVAVIDPLDGRLKLRTYSDDGVAEFAPVRLLADTPFLELKTPLYYRVDYTKVILGGKPGTINGFTFQAPNADRVLNLIGVSRKPGQSASGIIKIAPQAVRLDGAGRVVFSYAGVDIPDPLEIRVVPGPPGQDGADGAKTLVELEDITPVGIAVGKAADEASARTAIGAAPRSRPLTEKNAAYTAKIGELIPCNATAGGFTVTLPLAPPDGSTVWVRKTDSTTNTVTVQRSGSDVLLEPNGPSALQLFTQGQAAALQYEAGVWWVVAHSATVTGLDERYVIRHKQPPGSLIRDNLGSPALQIYDVENAQNYVGVQGGATGIPPRIRAMSAGISANLDLMPKGQGSVNILAGDGSVSAEFRAALGYNYFSFRPSLEGAAMKIAAAARNAADANDAINLSLVTQGAGVVTVESSLGGAASQVEVKGHKHTIADVAGARSWSTVPASANAAGAAGQEAYDAGFHYVCVAANTWKRTPLTGW